MMKPGIFLLVALFSASQGKRDPYSAPQCFEQSLMKHLDSGDSNVIISPLVTKILTSQVMVSCKGQSTTECNEVLDVAHVTDEEVERQYQSAIPSFMNIGKASQFYMATAMFVNESCSPKQSMINDLKTYFYSDIIPVNFGNTKETSDKVNKWGESVTSSQLRKILPDDLGEDNKMVPVGIFMMHPNFASGFYQPSNTKGTFQNINGSTSQVTYMHNEDVYNVYRDDKCTALEMMLSGRTLSMLVISYKNKTHALQDMDCNKIRTISQGMRPEVVKVSMPKVTMTSQVGLPHPWRHMGMKRALTPDAAADFPDCQDTPYISDGFIQSKMIMDGDGGISTADNTSKLPKSNMNFDSPYMMIMQHKWNGQMYSFSKVNSLPNNAS